MAISVKITGVDEAVATLKGLPERMEARVILDLSQVAYDSMNSGAERHSKTGAMLQSLFNRAIPNGRMVGHDTERAPQAIWVTQGTKPHVIQPKNKKALRWPVGNGFVFAKKVNHPGYIGDNYIARAADDAVREFARIVTDSLKPEA